MVGRIMAMDFGLKRTGIAVTDPLQIAVHSLTTVLTQELKTWTTAYLRQEKVVKLVLGDPSAGVPEEHELMRGLKLFYQWFTGTFPHIEVAWQDEMLTSQRAGEVIRQAGIKKKKRQDKGLVDKVSAVIILQQYLGHH